LRGPVEGWLLLRDSDVYVVKGCEHPLPCIHVVAKRVGGDKVDPFLYTGGRWSPCLYERVGLYCPGDDGRLVDPVEALESSRMRLQDEIVSMLYSQAPGYVGLTGSTLYSRKPRDIDIVVYGVQASQRILEAVLELWLEGRAKPPPLNEYSSVRREYGVREWVLLARFRPLLFSIGGRVYSVKLVSCQAPVACSEPLARQPVYTRAYILERLSPPCTIPGVYRVSTPTGPALLYTLRSSLSCLPRCTLLEGVFTLEVYRGYSRLVPDGRRFRIRVLQG